MKIDWARVTPDQEVEAIHGLFEGFRLFGLQDEAKCILPDVSATDGGGCKISFE